MAKKTVIPCGYKTYFVSGHRNIPQEEFDAMYVPQIDGALRKKCVFVVGDYEGADRMAQDYLKSKGATCVVFHMFDTPRYNAGFPTMPGFKTDEARDHAMSVVSDQDIAFVKSGKENSGTAQNLYRRMNLKVKTFDVFDLIRENPANEEDTVYKEEE